MANFQLLGVWTGGSWGMSVGASPNFSSFLLGSRLVWASLLCIIKIRLSFNEIFAGYCQSLVLYVCLSPILVHMKRRHHALRT